MSVNFKLNMPQRFLRLLLTIFCLLTPRSGAYADESRGLPPDVAIGNIIQKLSAPRFEVHFPEFINRMPEDSVLSLGGGVKWVYATIRATSPKVTNPVYMQIVDNGIALREQVIQFPERPEGSAVLPLGNLFLDFPEEALEVAPSGAAVAILFLVGESSVYRRPLTEPMATAHRSFHIANAPSESTRYLLVVDAGETGRGKIELRSSEITSEDKVALKKVGSALDLAPGEEIRVLQHQYLQPAVVAVHASGSVRKLLLTGAGGFKEILPVLAGKPLPPLVGDFNGDGIIEALYSDTALEIASFGRDFERKALPCHPDAPMHGLDFDGDHNLDVFCWSSDRSRWTVFFGERKTDGASQAPARFKERFESIGAPFDPDHSLRPFVGPFRMPSHDTIILIRSLYGPWYMSDYLDWVGAQRIIISLDFKMSTYTGEFGDFGLRVGENAVGTLTPFAYGTTFFPPSIDVAAVQKAGFMTFEANEIKLEPLTSPQPCIGYNPANRGWSAPYLRNQCPLGYAIFANGDDPHTANVSSASCCPLPREDILESWVELIPPHNACPDNTVLTGNLKDRHINCPECGVCTYINTRKYALGPPKKAIYWGTGQSGSRGAKKIARAQIPLGIRYGIGRVSQDTWTQEGCIGEPFGSLLTFSTDGCSRTEFRELLEKRGAELSPVKMFPDCRALDSYQLPGTAHCIGTP